MTGKRYRKLKLDKRVIRPELNQTFVFICFCYFCFVSFVCFFFFVAEVEEAGPTVWLI